MQLQQSHGAGSSADAAVTPQQANELLSQGVKALDADLEAGLELLSKAVEVLAQHHAEFDIELARPYQLYGEALLRKAQAAGPLAEGAAPEVTREAARPELDKENLKMKVNVAQGLAADDKGKGKAPAPSSNGVRAPAADSEEEAGEGEEEGEGEGSSEEDEEGEGEGDADDLQLAWQMLDLSRLIHTTNGTPDPQQLADVHLSLGDLAAESSHFELSVAEYSAALQLLERQAQGGASLRRQAEAHYKAALGLQQLDKAEAAQRSVDQAAALLRGQLEELQKQADSGVSSAEEVEGEARELRAVLGDLAAKAEELQEAVASKASLGETICAAFSNLAQALPGGSAAGPAQQQQAQQAPSAAGSGRRADARQEPLRASAGAIPAGGITSTGFGPSGGITSTGFGSAVVEAGAGAGAGARAAPAPVRNLGVVGRGSKRITLAPAVKEPDGAKKAKLGSEPAPIAEKKAELGGEPAPLAEGQTVVKDGDKPAPAAS